MSTTARETPLEALRNAISPGATVVVLSPDPEAPARVAAEAAGPQGQVTILVPETEACDALARAFAQPAAGCAPVSVRLADWADLTLDVAAFEAWLQAHPPQTVTDLQAVAAERARLGTTQRLVANQSADVVFADRVLRALPPDRRCAAVTELYRIQQVAGRLILVEVVSDEPLSERLLHDAKVEASLQELELLQALEQAKFIGLELLDFPERPLSGVEGLEFRALLIRATKGKEGMCLERLQAVVYLGPWKVVEDDDGHVMRRGQRYAVCNKTYHVYQRPPYAGQFLYLDPAVDIPLEEAKPWDVRHGADRTPAETKGLSTARSDQNDRRAGSATPVTGDGVGYFVRAEWRDRSGKLLRRARLTHRFRGYFETAEEGLTMARTVFDDATRYEAVARPLGELLTRWQRPGKVIACPVPGPENQ